MLVRLVTSSASTPAPWAADRRASMRASWFMRPPSCPATRPSRCHDCLQRSEPEQVRAGPEAGDDPAALRRGHRLVAPGLARVDVGDVNLYDGIGHGPNRVGDRPAGMGVGAGV